MKRIVLGLVLVFLVACATGAASQPAEIHVPVPEGWTAVDQEYRYGRDDLWEYINGAAELFMTYRFRELVVADFEQNEGALTVSVYDMGSPLDAYGIFETEKPAEAKELADVGTAALLQPPYRGLLIKDRFYVKVEAGGGDIGTEALAEALRGVAEGLPGINGLPAELALLPAEGRVAGTLAFAGSDYLGLEDLKACLHAQYQDAEGEDYGLFVMKPSSTFLKNEAGKWATFAHGEHQVFSREIPYRGMIVLMGNREQLIGVSGFNEIERATVLLENLMR